MAKRSEALARRAFPSLTAMSGTAQPCTNMPSTSLCLRFLGCVRALDRGGAIATPEGRVEGIYQLINDINGLYGGGAGVTLSAGAAEDLSAASGHKCPKVGHIHTGPCVLRP